MLNIGRSLEKKLNQIQIDTRSTAKMKQNVSENSEKKDKMKHPSKEIESCRGNAKRATEKE